MIDRLLRGPIRVVADRTAAIAPHVDADALALLLVGALINVRVIEMLGGGSKPRVSQKRLVAAWAHLYRSTIATASVA